MYVLLQYLQYISMYCVSYRYQGIATLCHLISLSGATQRSSTHSTQLNDRRPNSPNHLLLLPNETKIAILTAFLLLRGTWNFSIHFHPINTEGAHKGSPRTPLHPRNIPSRHKVCANHHTILANHSCSSNKFSSIDI
jgi:hypothetical protein